METAPQQRAPMPQTRLGLSQVTREQGPEIQIPSGNGGVLEDLRLLIANGVECP